MIKIGIKEKVTLFIRSVDRRNRSIESAPTFLTMRIMRIDNNKFFPSVNRKGLKLQTHLRTVSNCDIESRTNLEHKTSHSRLRYSVTLISVFATMTAAGLVPVSAKAQDTVKESSLKRILDRKLTHIAPGSLTVHSNDAVNGSQLYRTNQALTTLSNATYAGFDYVGKSFENVYTYLNNYGEYLNAVNSGAGVTFFRTNSQLSDSEAVGSDSVAVGPAAIAQTDGSIAIGNRVKADGGRAVAICFRQCRVRRWFGVAW